MGAAPGGGPDVPGIRCFAGLGVRANPGHRDGPRGGGPRVTGLSCSWLFWSARGSAALGGTCRASPDPWMRRPPGPGLSLATASLPLVPPPPRGGGSLPLGGGPLLSHCSVVRCSQRRSASPGYASCTHTSCQISPYTFHISAASQIPRDALNFRVRLPVYKNTMDLHVLILHPAASLNPLED